MADDFNQAIRDARNRKRGVVLSPPREPEPEVPESFDYGAGVRTPPVPVDTNRQMNNWLRAQRDKSPLRSHHVTARRRS
jgi:hypothetical protein